MKIEYKHALTQGQAYQKIDKLLTALQERYADKITNPQKTWNADNTQMDYSIEILGFETKGKVVLSEGQVNLDGTIPFLARAFSKKIESKLKERLEALLA